MMNGLPDRSEWVLQNSGAEITFCLQIILLGEMLDRGIALFSKEHGLLIIT